VEEAAQLADDAEATPAGVQKAGLQVRTRQWMAERFDPQMFGEKNGQVNVNIGQLMLEALRQPPPVRALVAGDEPINAEVFVSEETDGTQV
jgi:hypothetical protein